MRQLSQRTIRIGYGAREVNKGDDILNDGVRALVFGSDGRLIP